jgi:phospholipid-transporting ATPase
LERPSGVKVALGADNMILRGCKLRNTEYAFGVTVFTGHDSKIMMNSTKPKFKFSSLEMMVSKAILLVLLTQLFMSFIGACFGSTWIFSEAVADENGAIPAYYLEFSSVSYEYTRRPDYVAKEVTHDGFALTTFKLTLTWVLLCTNLVPISLMVQMEVIKLIQATVISWDATMTEPAVLNEDGTCDEVPIPTRAQSSGLNEELGQVEYIFSDKTGTLTCNIMEFKKFSAGRISYGTGETPTSKQQPNVNFHDPNLAKVLAQKGGEDYDYLEKLILAMATCHTVIWDEKKRQYTASSPDELALVNAAKQFNFEFKGKNSDEIVTVKMPDGSLKTYQELSVCEFTSTRKR